MAFKDILGDARIKRILGRSLRKERLPNSLLFSGLKGIGKSEIAFVTAKALNCQNMIDDACEVCESCLSINKGNHPDIMHILPESDVLKIDQMRALKEAAYLKPMVGKKRVFIIENAEKMNAGAANSLLKVLEEPPAFAHLILVTDNPYIILPTIKSRCQVLKFSPISREDIESCLVQQGMDKTQARIISLLVRGNLKQAMNFDWEKIQAEREKAWKFFWAVVRGGNLADFLKELSIKRRAQAGEELNHMLEILASICRDLLLIKEEGGAALLMNPDYESEIREVAGEISTSGCLSLLRKIEDSLSAIQRNVNVRLLVSSMILNSMEKNHV